jgi:hypothetical protein
MRTATLILCAAVLATGCGGDDETTVVETTTVIETVRVPEPDSTTPVEPEPADPDAPASGNGGGEAPRDCGRIVFEPNTDSGASDIESVGGDCTAARSVARAARDAATDLSFEADGFQCSGAHSDQRPIAQVEWFCIGPDREVVTFFTS